MQTKKDRIIARAIEVIKAADEGIRYTELVRRLKQDLPEIPQNTIHGTVWNLEVRVPEEVYKPARGMYLHVSRRGDDSVRPAAAHQETEKKVTEEDFYEAFADFLVKDLEDCTKAIALGGNRFKDKWGTPDVIGVWRSRPSDVIKASDEIVTAEIKLDSSALITAFGQACSYKLFSHKSYLVVPRGSSEEDIKRLESLCMIFGIGLILFRADNAEDPGFEIRVSPAKHEPDMFYVNRNLKLVEEELLS